jgi:hypothetical protein
MHHQGLLACREQNCTEERRRPRACKKTHKKADKQRVSGDEKDVQKARGLGRIRSERHSKRENGRIQRRIMIDGPGELIAAIPDEPVSLQNVARSGEVDRRVASDPDALLCEVPEPKTGRKRDDEEKEHQGSMKPDNL